MRSVAAAVVREPLGRMLQGIVAKAVLDAFYHQIPVIFGKVPASVVGPSSDQSTARREWQLTDAAFVVVESLKVARLLLPGRASGRVAGHRTYPHQRATIPNCSRSERDHLA
jgi:hypothetical protein